MNFVANDPDVLSTEECAVFPCLTKFAGGPEPDFAAPAYASRPEMGPLWPGPIAKSLVGSDVDDRLPLRVAQDQESRCHCEDGR
jgi:hypothetical protein